MTLELTWWGHACFTLKSPQQTILIDPFFDQSPTAPIKAAQAEADFILQTHAHFDHLADTVPIALRTGATVLANFEICEWLKCQGIADEKLIAMNLGGGVSLPWGRVKMTLAHHSSSFPDGSYGGSPCGFLVEVADRKIYFAGDTALFFDMKLIGLVGLDVAVLPIGDLFTMGPADSIEAIKLLNCRRVVPSHYNTWPPIRQDAATWADRVRSHTACDPLVLEPGFPIEL